MISFIKSLYLRAQELVSRRPRCTALEALSGPHDCGPVALAKARDILLPELFSGRMRGLDTP